MAHNNNNPPSHFPSYPAWPQMAPAPQQHGGSFYPPPQPSSVPVQYTMQPQAIQNNALPPELQNLNITPEQFAALFQHFQTQSAMNAYPPPPPLPLTTAAPATAPPSAMSFAPSLAQTPVVLQKPRGLEQVQEQDLASPHLDNLATARLDREEGELSDADPEAHAGRTSSAPRKRKLNASYTAERLVSPRSSNYNSTQTNRHSHPRPRSTLQDISQPCQKQDEAAAEHAPDFSHEKETVLPFLTALHQQGFAFDELAREGLDIALLRNIYDELQIPVATKEVSMDAKSPDDSAARHEASNGVSMHKAKPAPQPEPIKTKVIKSPATPAPKSATAAPPDRQSYLARLQAAKNKKLSAPSPKPPQSVDATVPGPTDAPAPVVGALPSTKPSPVSIPTRAAPAPEQPPTKASGAATTELVRKRLEALKSLQRRTAPQPPKAVTPQPLDLAAQSAASVSHHDLAEAAIQTAAAPEPVHASCASAAAMPVIKSSTTPTSAGFSSAIPGLFMAATAPEKDAGSAQKRTSLGLASSSISIQSQQSMTKGNGDFIASDHLQPTSETPSRPISKQHRRPVASDLNEIHTPPAAPSYKRPFGRSRQKSSDDAMIIEVSDDEGTAGDDEQPATTSGPVTLRQKSIRDLPPLRDFPQRSVLNRSGTIQGTPTPLGTPGTSSDIEELKRKEQEINALQTRIQEFERRKKALRAKTQPAQARTESSSTIQRTGISDALDPGAQQDTDEPSQAIGRATAVLPGLSAIPGLEPAKLQATSDRHSQLNAHVPDQDTASSNRQTQMMELQRRMAELQKQLDEEDRKKQEAQKRPGHFDANLDGAMHSGIQDKRDDINRSLQENQTDNGNEAMLLDLEGPSTTNSQDAMPYSAESSRAGTAAATVSEDLDGPEGRETSSEEGQISDSDLANDSIESKRRAVVESLIVESLNRANVDSQATTVDDNFPSLHEERRNASTAVKLQGPPQDDNEGSSMSESSEDEDDEVELARLFIGNIPFSMTKDQLSAMFSEFDVASVDLPVRGKKPTGFAFVSLPLAQAVAAIHQLNNKVFKDRKLNVQMARPKDAPLQATVTVFPESRTSPSEISDSSDDEMNISDSSSDDSEGDAQDEEVAALDSNIARPIASDAADEEELEEDEMDLDSSDSDDDYEPAPAAVPAIFHEASAQPPSADLKNDIVADNDVPESKADTERHMTSEGLQSATEVSRPRYIPYESPLKMFKKYRFHPDYTRNVLSGYFSLTYSHNIKPDVPLCRFEFAGGLCHDQSCDCQHWRDMALSDDQLLIQFGTGRANPAKGTEDVARFNVGLKNIIQELRQDTAAVTETVAARIAQHRRHFIGDPTVVVSQ
ncbi:hypothetical protein BDV97DRAFT_363618 [Delphinella strobiligena]|nr:hypothetical protein BDV97DRAFT_363618 [Delphinella strobiligena]